MNIKIAAAGFAVASLALVGCSSNESSTESSPSPAATSAEASPTAAAEAGTIVEVASGNPDFSTLVAAVSAADLAETLGAEGPYTVFAPTNEAFEALPAGLLDELLKPKNKELLTQILTYHVVPARVLKAEVPLNTNITTVEGATFQVNSSLQIVDVANRLPNIVTTDVLTSNGVIHVIDRVILPFDPSLPV